MPIHDWTRVDEGIYHDFTLIWFVEISRHLNATEMPKTHYALVESYHSFELNRVPNDMPPQVYEASYAAKQKTITIRNAGDDHLVAMLENVKLNNIATRRGVRQFVNKALRSIELGIHLLVVDLLPRDPADMNIHDEIWSEIESSHPRIPNQKPLTMASYCVGKTVSAYVEPIAVGEVLCDMPLFLDGEHYVPVPLEVTYQAAWRGVPQRWKAVLEDK